MNPNFDIITLKRLEDVAPLLKRKVLAAMDALALEGIYIRVANGNRTFPEQDGLYALGRTVLKKSDGTHQGIVTNARGGYSNHNFGCAVDCYPFLTGHSGDLDWNPETAPFEKMIAAFKAEGLSWGGDWHGIVDKPHFQLANVPVTPTADDRKLLASGGMTAVWAQYDAN